jgi:hypothetical protein
MLVRPPPGRSDARAHLAFGVADEAELEAWRARRDELSASHGAIDD